MSSTQVALSLGCNLGNREFYISAMEHELRTILTQVRASPLMETEPVDTGDFQSPYLNKIIVGYYDGAARQLLDVCLFIELALDRKREKPKCPRTADIDILLFGDMEINEPALIIPHPRILRRRFCLEGLVSIDAAIVVPGIGRSMTIGELYKNMSMDIAVQNVSFDIRREQDV